MAKVEIHVMVSVSGLPVNCNVQTSFTTPCHNDVQEREGSILFLFVDEPDGTKGFSNSFMDGVNHLAGKDDKYVVHCPRDYTTHLATL